MSEPWFRHLHTNPDSMTRVHLTHIIAGWLVASMIGAALMIVAPASAQLTPDGNCNGFNPNDPYGLDCGDYSGLSDDDPRLITARIINFSLSLLGIIVTVIITFAGWKWMTAGGNEEEAKSARRILVAAIIGLMIILSAYAISNFALNRLAQATDVGASYYE